MAKSRRIKKKKKKEARHWEEAQGWAWEDKSLKPVLPWILCQLHAALTLRIC